MAPVFVLPEKALKRKPRENAGYKFRASGENRSTKRRRYPVKIDISKIQGYADMSDVDKVRALEQLDLPEADYTGWVKKDAFDRAASEAADWKKKYNAQLSAEEQKQQAESEELTQLRTQVEQMKREKSIADYTAQFAQQGWDAKLAADTAKALYEGDMAAVFKAQQQFMEGHDKSLRQKLLSETPQPPAGGGTGGSDYTKKAEDALRNGDTAAAAYYMRIAQTPQQ